MKTVQKKLNQVEWLNTEVMHKASREWLSELRFIKNEQLFFDDLIKTNTLLLIDSNHFEKSRTIVNQLGKLQKKTKLLIKDVKKHENDLQIMVNSLDQPLEEENYKKEHRRLIIVVNEFFYKNRALKTQLFKVIKSIMKAKKLHLLIDKK